MLDALPENVLEPPGRGMPLGRRRGKGKLRYMLSSNIGVAIAAAVLAILVLASVLAPILPIRDPNAGTLIDSMLPPGHGGHLLGTDQLGRDLFARCIYAIRTTLGISVTVTLAAMVIGMVLGVLAGFFKMADGPIMRIVDIQMAFPALILAIAVVAALGRSSALNLIIVLVIAGWVSFARVARGMTLSIKQTLYVEAAGALGSGRFRIVREHVVPNALPVLAAMAVSDLPMVMIQAASLNYLGLGVPASTPALGAMIKSGQDSLFSAWWPAVIPAAVMALVVLCATSIGDFATRYAND